ncbi:MAG: helix-turn-helix transcriptional regulator [Spirulina sp. SIO3F2]|nr:helix-turn-helix transcriptional regulator [Spirulina sp. SIO3F2]
MEIQRTIEVTVEGLGDRIREFRKKDPRSVEEIAKQADMTRSHWYDIENEALRLLPEKTLRKIEKALGVDFGVSFDSVLTDSPQQTFNNPIRTALIDQRDRLLEISDQTAIPVEALQRVIEGERIKLYLDESVSLALELGLTMTDEGWNAWADQCGTIVPMENVPLGTTDPGSVYEVKHDQP